MKGDALTPRAQHLLQLLIEYYIRDGQPVSSRTLADDSSISFSSATIRNVLADLEVGGYLHAPHASAGRVPTVQGYRLFVDSLLTVKPPTADLIEKVKQSLNPELTVQDLINNSSDLISKLSLMVGLVTVPERDRALLHYIEFLPLSENKVLVVLVFNEKEVKNRIIFTERPFSKSELEQAGNYLMSVYAGKDLATVRHDLMQDLQKDHEHVDQLLRDAMIMASRAVEDENLSQDLVLAGELNLLNQVDEKEVNHIQPLMDALNQKKQILHLLDQSLASEGVKIFIGQESGYQFFDDYSLITSTYNLNDGEMVGVLGVIGPTRMPYDKVIPLVEITAKFLSFALNKR